MRSTVYLVPSLALSFLASLSLPAAADCQGCNGSGGGSPLNKLGSCGTTAQLLITPLVNGVCEPEGSGCVDGTPCRFTTTYGWNFGTTYGYLGGGYRLYDSDDPNNPLNGGDSWQIEGSSGQPGGVGSGQVELFLMCGGQYEAVLRVQSADPACPDMAQATASAACSPCLFVISGPG
jgi:hypothetical protein